MNVRLQAAGRIWRTGRARATRDRLFTAYAVLLTALIAGVPLGRAVWLSASGPAGIAVLGASGAPQAAAIITSALWTGALLLGRSRGPALLPPFLAYALGTSDLDRSIVLRGPFWRAGALVTAATTAAAALVGGALASAGLTDASGFLCLVAAGALVGVITAVAWLAGQALGRAAAPIALGVAALGAITVPVPAAGTYTPAGWVQLAYPGPDATAPAPASLVALATLAAALIAAAPTLLNRLHLAELIAQAVRWDAATTLAAGLDLDAAAAHYRARPHRGRRWRAVRASRTLWATVLRRNAIGSLRTPGRLLAGIACLIGAGLLIAAAASPAIPGILFGALAGPLAFVGLGPFTDGLRHAAAIAADLPLYGVGDGRMLALQLVFPVLTALLVLTVTVLVAAPLLGTAASVPALDAIVLAPLALLTRAIATLKGPMPPALLTPIPTAAGDLAAAARAVWAVDGILFALLCGVAAALGPGSPILPVVASVLLAGIGLHRWRRRA